MLLKKEMTINKSYTINVLILFNIHENFSKTFMLQKSLYLLMNCYSFYYLKSVMVLFFHWLLGNSINFVLVIEHDFTKLLGFSS